jgi:hypothetical protein
MEFKSSSWDAERIQIGDFKLSQSLVDKITNFKPLEAKREIRRNPNYAQKSNIQLVDGIYYFGDDPVSPKVGDLRVGFSYVAPQDYSIISKQIKNSFEPYRTKSGGTVELLSAGTHSADEMFKQAEDLNRTKTWIWRGLGFGMMALGLFLVLKPLSVAADVIPFIGDIVEVGGLLVAILLAGCLSLITIAIAWIFYRPVLAIAMLVIACLLVYGAKQLKKKDIPGSSDATTITY